MGGPGAAGRLVSFVENPSFVGDAAVASCLAGLEPEGVTNYTCLASGAWSDGTMTCEPSRSFSSPTSATTSTKQSICP